MLSSDWLIKRVFFLPILSFFSFSPIAGVFVRGNSVFHGICLVLGKSPARGKIPSLNSL